MQDIFSFNIDPGLVLSEDVITKVTRSGEVSLLGTSVPDDMFMKMHIHTTITPNLDVTSSFSKPEFRCE